MPLKLKKEVAGGQNQLIFAGR